MKEKIRVHIFISGKVQGVFFRRDICKKAEDLDVFGWVKNLVDGRVETVFEGDKDKVEKAVKWVKKGGSLAKIDNFELILEQYKDEFRKFKIV